MDTGSAEQFRDRWRAVQEVQQKEALEATFESRWQKLNAVFSLGKGLQLTSSHADEMQVYQRWAKLKEILPRAPKA